MKNKLEDLIALELDTRKFGFDWPHTDMVIEQAISECEEIRAAINEKEPSHRIQEEIGDLIHTAISLCIYEGFDTHETIDLAVKKFSKRMAAMKALTKENGLENLNGQSSEFMFELWKIAKKA